MNIFTLIKKNIRWNLKNYLLYFCSIVFIITVVFSFNSLQQSEQIKAQLGGSMTVLLGIGAFFIHIFAFIFLWYSNSFFTKNRQKEVGLYSLLGLEKRKIANMLFAENMMIGGLALAVGMAIGSLISKYMIMFLFKMMEMYIQVSYELPISAIVTTAITFAVIFVILSIHSYSMIYRFKLIEFFSASKRNEKVPKGSMVMGLISVLMIGAGYAVALSKFVAIFPLYVLTVLTLVIVGTYGLFLSSLVILGRLSKKNTKKYYNGLNMINTSNFICRVKSNAYVLGSIAILSAVTISAVGMSYGFYHGIQEDSENMSPVHFQYEMGNKPEIGQLESIIAQSVSKDQIQFEKEIALKARRVASKGNFSNEMGLRIMKVSDFKALNAYHEIGLAPELHEDEAYFFQDPMSGGTLMDESLPENIKLDNLSIHVLETRKNNLVTVSWIKNILVVNDAVYEALPNTEDFGEMTVKLIDFKDLAVGRQIDKALMTFEKMHKDIELNYNSYTMMYDMQMQWRGMFMFSGVFLGLVILVATGSIIYFKLLNEATEEKARYEVLRKIGVSHGEIKKSISKQVLVMFSIPVLVGITHGIFAMAALSKLLARSLVVSTSYIIVAFLVIYSIYYVLTVKKYNEVVNKAA